MRNLISIVALFLAAVATFSFTKNAPTAAFDAFLEIEGIKGESKIQQRAFDIIDFQLDSFSHSITFRKNFNRISSMQLDSFSSREIPLKTATFKVKPKGQTTYYEIKLENTMISSYQISRKAGGSQHETFALNYEEIRFFQTKNGVKKSLGFEKGFDAFRKLQN